MLILFFKYKSFWFGLLQWKHKPFWICHIHSKFSLFSFPKRTLPNFNSIIIIVFNIKWNLIWNRVEIQSKCKPSLIQHQFKHVHKHVFVHWLQCWNIIHILLMLSICRECVRFENSIWRINDVLIILWLIGAIELIKKRLKDFCDWKKREREKERTKCNYATQHYIYCIM